MGGLVVRLGLATAAIVAGLAIWTSSDFADERGDAEAMVSAAEVAAPTRQGYGSDVICDLLKFEFGGHVDVVFAADGLRCTIELPANAETLA